MNQSKWFSTKLRFAVLVAPEGGDQMNDQVYVFKSDDFPAAFQRALSIGLANEKRFLNGQGKEVLWKFAEVRTLDVVQCDDLDGAEICSEFVDLTVAERYPLNAHFSPQSSTPIQTL